MAVDYEALNAMFFHHKKNQHMEAIPARRRRSSSPSRSRRRHWSGNWGRFWGGWTVTFIEWSGMCQNHSKPYFLGNNHPLTTILGYGRRMTYMLKPGDQGFWVEGPRIIPEDHAFVRLVGGFQFMGLPRGWMVCKGKSHENPMKIPWKRMIWG